MIGEGIGRIEYDHLKKEKGKEKTKGDWPWAGHRPLNSSLLTEGGCGHRRQPRAWSPPFFLQDGFLRKERKKDNRLPPAGERQSRRILRHRRRHSLGGGSDGESPLVSFPSFFILPSVSPTSTSHMMISFSAARRRQRRHIKMTRGIRVLQIKARVENR